MKFAASALTVAVGLPATSWSQGVSVEELERRLQKAKEERAQRDAAAAKGRDAAESDRKRREAEESRAAAERKAEESRAAAERKAQEARQATLVVQADAPCTLSVNGKEVTQVAKGITEVKVSPGQKLINCVSSEERVSFEGQVEARSGQDTVLRVALAGRVLEIRSAKSAEAQARSAEAQARRESEARAREQAERARLAQDREQRAADEMSKRLQPLSEDMLFDSMWGLQWQRTGSPIDMTWHQAQAYCRSLGVGWSLPTVEQLQSLYQVELPRVKCGTGSCRLSGLFTPNAGNFWSSELDPTETTREVAWTIKFDYAGANKDIIKVWRYVKWTGTAALCVRRQ